MLTNHTTPSYVHEYYPLDASNVVVDSQCYQWEVSVQVVIVNSKSSINQ